MAEGLYMIGRKEEAIKIIEEAKEIMKIIPGEKNYSYTKYFLPKYAMIVGK